MLAPYPFGQYFFTMNTKTNFHYDFLTKTEVEQLTNEGLNEIKIAIIDVLKSWRDSTRRKDKKFTCTTKQIEEGLKEIAIDEDFSINEKTIKRNVRSLVNQGWIENPQKIKIEGYEFCVNLYSIPFLDVQMSLTNTNTITNTITKTININNNINIKEKEIYKEKDVLTDVKCNSLFNSSSSIEDNSNLTKQEQDNLIQLEEEIYNHQQLKEKLQQFTNDEEKLQWCINTYSNWKVNMQENYKSIMVCYCIGFKFWVKNKQLTPTQAIEQHQEEINKYKYLFK